MTTRFTRYRNDKTITVTLDGKWGADAAYQENSILWHDQFATPRGTTCSECGDPVGSWGMVRCADPATFSTRGHRCDALTHLCHEHAEIVDVALSEYEEATKLDKAFVAVLAAA